MYKLLLIREPAQGKAIMGKLYLIRQENSESQRKLLCDTLENNDFKIPALTFPLSVTYSPKFKRPLPLIGGVPHRSGIRFHRGSRPEHSSGCILVRTHEQEESIKALIKTHKINEITIESNGEKA